MSRKLTLKEFKEQFNRSPSDPKRIAEAAAQVIDCAKLRNAAQRYLDAKARYEAALDEIDFERG